MAPSWTQRGRWPWVPPHGAPLARTGAGGGDAAPRGAEEAQRCPRCWRGRGAVRGAERGEAPQGAARFCRRLGARPARPRWAGGSGAGTRQGSSPSEGFSLRHRGAGDFVAVCLSRRIAPLPLQLYSQRQTEIALKRFRKGISVPSQTGMALPPPAATAPCEAEKTFWPCLATPRCREPRRLPAALADSPLAAAHRRAPSPSPSPPPAPHAVSPSPSLSHTHTQRARFLSLSLYPEVHWWPFNEGGKVKRLNQYEPSLLVAVPYPEQSRIWRASLQEWSR